MSRRRLIVLVVALIFLGFILVDTLGVFDDSPYMEVPHGNHTHYVPKERNDNVSISAFPTVPPGPCERITPEGRIVDIPDCQPQPPAGTP
jgi:hypothetical protein